VDVVERMRAWSYQRLRIGHPARTLYDALNAVVAVYATHPTCPLALRARSRSFTPARYRSLDRGRGAIRLSAMRRTVFLVPTKNAASVFNAVRPSEAQTFGRLKRVGYSMADYRRIAKRILVAAREPLSQRRLEAIAGIKGRELTVVLQTLRLELKMITLAGESMNSSPHRYVATSAWAPEILRTIDEEDGLAWLAREYLRAFGPARVEDFVWWTGTGKRRGAAAVASLPTVDVGDGYLLPKKDAPSFDKVHPVRNVVALLPRWDPYTMGYAPDGRRRFVHPEVQERVYTPIGIGLPGDGNPVVLVDGEAVATWTYTVKEGPAVQPFDRLGPKTRRRVDEELFAIAGLLTR
jgi:Winged helix DNA-binding domain